MRHKWTINLLPYRGMKNTQCSVCRCIKSELYGRRMYETSGGNILSKVPDCIDWEIENAKTID